ncbi:MAG: hypothetical protein K0S85_1325 [Pseudomonas orientalis]|nr:hypothetical protein [Pseudomonas orientalis]
MNSAREQGVEATATAMGRPLEKVHFVARILEMWGLLEASARGLCPSDKARLTESLLALGEVAIFPGFDSSTEVDELSIARHLANQQENWPHFKGRLLEADFAMVSSYIQMLQVFESVRASTPGYDPLHVNDLIAIMRAGAR